MLLKDLNIHGLFTEYDKRWHMAICAAIVHLMIFGMWVLTGTYSLAIASGLTLTLGLMKEAGDDNTPLEHFRDILADMIGISTCLVWLIV